ncbi:hypothetical protein IFR05_008370 [Cadophora sp. M221]|nr:hypothetical protein IFR05_008370 [Cadophora sp. M221]
MALYIQVNKQTGQRNIVTINGSLRFQRRLVEAASMRALVISDIETMFTSSALRNWQEYFSHLERRLNDVNIKANFSGFHHSHSSEKSGVGLEPKDLQSMYEIRNKLSLGQSALGASRETLKALGDDITTPTSSQDVTTNETSMQNIASMARRELNSNIERADNLMQRMDGILGLVRSIIDIQTAMAVQNSSDKANEAAAHANEMAKLAREDNTVMLQLSARASEDGHTLKVITVLTLVYLPAMFVATLMGTGYVKIGYTEAANKMEIRISGEMIVFVVLTALLLIATLGAWAVFERKYRRNRTLRIPAVSSG